MWGDHETRSLLAILITISMLVIGAVVLDGYMQRQHRRDCIEAIEKADGTTEHDAALRVCWR